MAKTPQTTSDLSIEKFGATATAAEFFQLALPNRTAKLTCGSWVYLMLQVSQSSIDTIQLTEARTMLLIERITEDMRIRGKGDKRQKGEFHNPTKLVRALRLLVTDRR